MPKINIEKNQINIDSNFNTRLLKPKDTLYPKFWKNNKLNPIVARKLMLIADSSNTVTKHTQSRS